LNYIIKVLTVFCVCLILFRTLNNVLRLTLISNSSQRNHLILSQYAQSLFLRYSVRASFISEVKALGWSFFLSLRALNDPHICWFLCILWICQVNTPVSSWINGIDISQNNWLLTRPLVYSDNEWGIADI